MNEKFKRIIDKGEWMAGLAAILGIGIKMSQIPAGGMLVVLSLGTLSVFYFFEAYLPSGADTEPAEKNMNKLHAMGSSMGVTGILFALQNWPGSKVILLMGCVTVVLASLVFISALKRKGETNFLGQKKIKRSLIIVLFAVALSVIPKQTLLDYHIHRPLIIENQVDSLSLQGEGK